MVHLKNPPLPKNKNVIAVVLLALLALVILATVLLGEIVEKPRQNEQIQDQINALEVEIAEKAKLQKEESMAAAIKANEFDPSVSAQENTYVPESNAKFMQQEENLQSHETSELDYLKERVWGFWYIVLPLFILVFFFILWVRKKHKDWIK